MGLPDDYFSRPVVIVAAHPDDETIGLGGQLPRFTRDVFVVHVTQGSPRNLDDAHRLGFENGLGYAEARQKEVRNALAVAGVPEKHCLTLGILDQEASLQLAEVAHRLFVCFYTIQPRLVFTHPYEGGHPDHDATAFAVHQALEMLRSRQVYVPEPWEFTSYHAGPNGLETGKFLNDPAVPEYVQLLTESERELKQRMFDCFNSQRDVLQGFSTEAERFRRTPDYDFSQPPHPGRLHYENFDWKMTGSRWRSLASSAMRSAESA